MDNQQVNEFGDPIQDSQNYGIDINTRNEFGDLVVNPNKPSTQVSEEPSGYYEGFLSGLSNDENNKVFWLAKRRFPEIYNEGKDPSLYYAFDKNERLFYMDPETGQKKYEFEDSYLLDDISYLDNIGPAGQFLTEVAGGMKGLVKGAPLGIPGMIVGGIKGTGKGALYAYGVRQGLSTALGGPPLNIDKAAEDGLIAAAFGGLPFGGPPKAAGTAFGKKLLNTFPGTDGRSILKDIVRNGGNDADSVLAYMNKVYPDIKISRAEATGLVGSKGYQAEAFISKHARNEKMLRHYADRNERVKYHAEKFIDKITEGTFVGGRKTKIAIGDADDEITRLAKEYIDKEKELLRQRTKPMYKDAYEWDTKIDVSDFVDDLTKKLEDKNIKGNYRKSLESIKDSFTDLNTGQLKDTTELLHNTLKNDFRPLIETLTKDNQRRIKQEISTIRSKLSNRMKEQNPLYAQVTGIYDDALGNAQILDRSIVGQFAKIANLSGEQGLRATKKLFSGNIKPREINELKKILQSTDEGADAWQNLKGTWLATQFDDAVVKQINPLGEPHAFLRALGIKSPQRAFTPIGQLDDMSPEALSKITSFEATGKKAKMWQAIMEPEELKSFIDLTNMMHMVGRIQTQAGSDTFANVRLGELIANEARQVLGSDEVGKQVGRKVGGFFAALGDIPSRLTGYGFKDLMSLTRNRQNQAYVDLLIKHIIDPKLSAETALMLDSASPYVYAISQAFARGGKERVEDLVEATQGITSDTELKESRRRRSETGSDYEILDSVQETPEDTSDLQSSIQNFQMPNIKGSAFPDTGKINPAVSPTVLPNPQDRELAMRRSGLAGLV